MSRLNYKVLVGCLAEWAVDLVLHLVEDAVYETLGVRIRERLTQVDRFVDADDRRNVGAVEQLVDREAQDGQVDLGDAVEGPVACVAHDFVVDLFDVVDCAMDELLSKGVVVAAEFLVFDEDAQRVVELFGFVELPLVEELHRTGAAVAAL